MALWGQIVTDTVLRGVAWRGVEALKPDQQIL